MKKLLTISICLTMAMLGVAQEYNTEWNNLSSYVKRMYMEEPFDGARIVEDLDNCYLISAVAETISDNTHTMNRKAEVKALSAANTFLNGTRITQNTIMYTKETSTGYSYEEFEDFIESRSMGYIQTMQLLKNFEYQGKKVYIYCKKMPMPNKPKTKVKRNKK